MTGQLTCMNAGDERNPCRGTVAYHRIGNGTALPRCERHWDLRLQTQQGIDSRYGGSCAPSSFDPAYCGERWDEE